MKRTLLALIASLTLAGAMFTTPAMAQNNAGKMSRPRRERREQHPMIRRAINALTAAKDDLEDASHDFCGHRDEAREAANNALRQLQLALASDRTAVDPMGFGNEVGFQKASWAQNNERPNRGGRERHPKIRQAIRALMGARKDLQNAARDFNGHREAALDATNNAIQQLQKALACDKK